ncbi:MAG: fibronectin type III domain-containing protein [Thaumarchaeota archaeon]|nr:fibronectin type III domain-containing protein [Nitrososphaerota archaeon]MBT4176552.1 fibronectin type III domain-containing protein [Nitrososphaerota archaeon]MBT4675505.1 fibronectin type III domain-containing protein [Nitrososphaerota archaeon]
MHKVPFLIIILITISLIPFSFSEGIPEWVKNNASWWSERQISQTEFTNALEFLINEGIIYIPPTDPGIPGPDKNIPDWVRNTAGWWSDGKIPDSGFINAMKYLIEIGIIEVDASSPEIIVKETIEETLGTSSVSGKPLLMLLEGYNHVAADGKYALDVLIFDAEKYPNASPTFNKNASYTIDGVKIDILLYNEDGLIHTYSGLTKNGLFKYDVMAKETNQKGTLWMINNLYTVNITASLDGQTIEKQIEFLGQASGYAYNAGSAIRAPGDLTATAGNDQVTLSWTSPSGVKGISDYRIEYSTGFNGPWTTFSHTASDAVTDVVDGLDDSTKYYFRVAAENYSGTGKYSAVASATTT